MRNEPYFILYKGAKKYKYYYPSCAFQVSISWHLVLKPGFVMGPPDKSGKVAVENKTACHGLLI